MAQITRAERIEAVLFLFIGVVVTGAVVLLLVGLPFGKEEREYRLRFTESVIGLDEGTPVRYKGVKYGQIKAVAVNPEHPEEIIVTLAVEPTAPIKASTTARISTNSILGPYYIELLDSRADSPDLAAGSFIPASPSALSRILKTGESVSEDLGPLFANLKAWTAEEQRARFFGALDQARATLAAAEGSLNRLTPAAEEAIVAWRDLGREVGDIVRKNRSDGERLLADASAAVARLRSFLDSGRLDALTDTARRDLDTLTGELTASGERFRKWLDDHHLAPLVDRAVVAFERVQSSIAAIGANLEGEAISTARSDLSPALLELRSATQALRRAIEGFERSPRSLLFGSPPAEKRLPGEAPR